MRERGLGSFPVDRFLFVCPPNRCGAAAPPLPVSNDHQGLSCQEISEEPCEEKLAGPLCSSSEAVATDQVLM